MGGTIRLVTPPEDMLVLNFEYVLVASSKYQEITEQLVNLGIGIEKIKQVYNFEIYSKDEVIKSITKNNFYCSPHEYEIGGRIIDLGDEHSLVRHQRELPMYDSLIGVLPELFSNGTDWIIDIGANVGDSIYALCERSKANILAVEPAKVYYRLLQKM